MMRKKALETQCTVRVINTFDSLEAHVELDDGITIEPGDEVRVHGAPIVVPYGEQLELRRRASVQKASLIERAWTRLTGDLEFMELCEFSFSAEKKL